MTNSTTETRKINHALAHGRIDPQLLNREIALGFGAHKAATAWPTWRGKCSDLLLHLSTFQIGAKDGPALLQGYLREGADGRKMTEMVANHIMLLDLETGAPIGELVDVVKKQGLLAVLYSTHSHLKTVSDYNVGEVSRWMAGNDRGTSAPTLTDAIEFMRILKRVSVPKSSRARRSGRQAPTASASL